MSKPETIVGTYCSTAQEDVLADEDLRALILSQFGDPVGEDGAATRYSLLQAALVSKAFSESALDALWETLESARPLLNLFVPSATVGLDHVFISWERITSYTKRVRQLTVTTLSDPPNPETRDDLHPISAAAAGVIHEMQDCPEPLLPHLKQLDLIFRSPINTDNTSDLVNIFFWTSPSITDVSLEFNELSGDAETIMEGLLENAPDIQRLEWSSNSAKVAKYCPSFRSLTHIVLSIPIQPGKTPPHPDILEEMLGCVSLESLDLCLYKTEASPYGIRAWKDIRSGRRFNRIHLPALRSFTARGYPSWLLQSLLQLSPTLPELEDISLYRSWDESYEDVQYWEPILWALTPCSKLRTLEFGSTDSGEVWRTPWEVICKRGTLNLTNLPTHLARSKSSLEEISVVPDLFVYSGNSQSLAKAFPNLARFNPPLSSAIPRRQLLDPFKSLVGEFYPGLPESFDYDALKRVLPPHNLASMFAPDLGASKTKQFFEAASQRVDSSLTALLHSINSGAMSLADIPYEITI